LIEQLTFIYAVKEEDANDVWHFWDAHRAIWWLDLSQHGTNSKSGHQDDLSIKFSLLAIKTFRKLRQLSGTTTKGEPGLPYKIAKLQPTDPGLLFPFFENHIHLLHLFLDLSYDSI
jgi:hypothetical protein